MARYLKTSFTSVDEVPAHLVEEVQNLEAGFFRALAHELFPVAKSVHRCILEMASIPSIAEGHPSQTYWRDVHASGWGEDAMTTK